VFLFPVGVRKSNRPVKLCIKTRYFKEQRDNTDLPGKWPAAKRRAYVFGLKKNRITHFANVKNSRNSELKTP